jgi:ATPase family associated with various cellular activities (AAA)
MTLDALQEYLSHEFHTDRQDVEAIEGLVEEASRTLASAFSHGSWPYQVKQGSTLKAKPPLSHSTVAMITVAINRLLGKTNPRANERDALRFPFAALDTGLRKELRTVAAAAFSRLISREGIIRGSSRTKNISVTLKSTTYGLNAVLTLSYLIELLDFSSEDVFEKAVCDNVRQKAHELSKHNPRKPDKFFHYPAGGARSDVMSNAFIPLRATQIICHVNQFGKQLSEKVDLPLYRQFFEDNIHTQLSYSSIPDSRFDPADLVFSVEGLLLSQREAVDQSTMARVVEVLTHAQDENVYWRPTKPFLSNERGEVLFPVSVEVANSLIRSCELFDGKQLYDTFASASMNLFRKYARWLRARTVRFHADIKDDKGNVQSTRFVGWHSENVNDPGLLHTWETSQALEFLLNYRRVLKGHIARTTLIRSRLSLRSPDRRDLRKREWKDICFDYEPTNILGDEYMIYQKIGENFALDWKDGQPENFSMLVYGPPGTGKTTVAENVADFLGFRLITITVSDFLAGGGKLLEANAKAIFDVLTSQSDCVILFDEIDSFLLDRDSPRHGQQAGTEYEFMTPGMLTKLSDLRREKRVIFVIATNYDNRIDSAIKRTGRVDYRFLLLPPDRGARKRILTKLMEERWRVCVKDRDPRQPVPEGSDESQKWEEFEVVNWESLLRESLFLGYKDMDGCVKEVGRKAIEALAERLGKRARTTRFPPYFHRFDDPNEREKPIEEFRALVRLALEVRDDVDELYQRFGTEKTLAQVVCAAVAELRCGAVNPEKSAALIRDWARALSGPALKGMPGSDSRATMPNGQ